MITPDQLQGDRLILTSEQQHYLRRVLRLKGGDRFLATTGQGNLWLAQLPLADPTGEAHLLEQRSGPPPLPVEIYLLAALPKTGFDEVVRQATELGVGQIMPVISERTLLKPSPQKLERWRRIAQEATEQCERAEVPAIADPLSWVQVLTQPVITEIPVTGRFLCAARGASAPLWQTVQRSHKAQNSRIALAVGPEGGWTPGEIETAIAHQFQPVSLGSTILRAVTAPLAAIALIQAVYSKS